LVVPAQAKALRPSCSLMLLSKKILNTKFYILKTGQKFREFSQEVGITAKLTADVLAKGGLLPSFLPIWMWTNIFVRNIQGNEHLVLDGLSRRQYEAPILDDALKFYKREKPFVVSIETGKQWAIDRLLSRGRSDDKKEEIESRQDWYEANVAPTIEYFKNNPYYTVLTINGEQSIEDVHKEILTKTGL
jgi:adenylate kinase family enzyme